MELQPQSTEEDKAAEARVRLLFQQHSIPEIEQYQRKLQTDIEEKKEELRTMVGERYRDLLKAADSIVDMKATGLELLGHVDDIMAKSKSKNEQQLLGFKFKSERVDGSDSWCTDREERNFYSCVMQIRILTVLPEMIWTNIDEEQYLRATELFVFARHISTGLQLDMNRQIMSSFPVAKKQWSILSQFYSTIKQTCIETLERIQLNPEVAANCLASLVLLENSPIESLLSRFISLRSKAFSATLSDSQSLEGRVKDKMLSSQCLLWNTLELISFCFIKRPDNSDCLLLSEFEGLKNSKPTLETIDLDDSVLIGALPEIISKFKPMIHIRSINSDVVRQTIDSWLKQTELDAIRYLKPLINIIPSIKMIGDVKYEAITLNNKLDVAYLELLHLPLDFDCFQRFYQPFVDVRVRNIIKTSWTVVLNEMKTRFNDLLSKENGGEINSFIWTDDRIDTARKQIDSNHDLLMKTKGYTKSICDLCSLFDHHLETLVNDLQQYYSFENKSEQMHNEYESLLNFVKESAGQGMKDFIQNITDSKIESTKENYCTMARLLLAIPQLCPNLRFCVCPPIKILPRSIDQYSMENLNVWDAMCSDLNRESLNFWEKAINIFVQELISEIRITVFPETLSYRTLLKEFSKWESIELEEKDEQENSIKSIIRVPYHPSISLQLFLHRFCIKLYEIVSHAIPNVILRSLTEQIIDELGKIYRRYVDFTRTNQNSAIQFYMDVKFIGLTLTSGHETSKNVSDNLQSLSNSFRECIDPFDFELIHKFIHNNTKLAAQRVQHQLGCIIMNFEHFNTMLTTQQLSGQQSERNPNILVLNTNESTVGWFPLLPVNSSVENTDRIAMDYKKPLVNKISIPSTVPVTGQSTANLSQMKSGAASFFGAMSQDWFR